MATAHVNSISNSQDGSANTIASSAGGNHTAGNLLAVHITGSGTVRAVQSIADTAGNSYVIAPSTRTTGATVGFTEIWYAKNILGNAANTVTVTYDGAVTFRRMACMQYSGADTTAPYDTFAVGSASAAGSVTSNSFTPAAAGNVNVAGIVVGTTGTFSAGANYVERVDNASDQEAEDRVDAPAGAQTASVSSSAGNTDWLITVASFKSATVAGTSYIVRHPIY